MGQLVTSLGRPVKLALAAALLVCRPRVISRLCLQVWNGRILSNHLRSCSGLLNFGNVVLKQILLHFIFKDLKVKIPQKFQCQSEV